MRRGGLVVWAGVLALLGTVSPARSQDSPEPEGSEAPAEPTPEPAPSPEEAALEAKKTEALEHFRSGVRFVERGEWDAALAEFRRSRELYPTQVALENTALCLRELKRHAEALDTYQQLLDEYGDKMDLGAKQALRDAMAALSPLVGRLLVRVKPPGATVFVDNIERGTAPASEAINVNAGARFVRVYKEGFIPFEQEVTVAGGAEKTVTASLIALSSSGRLRVEEASGKQLEVLVDGGVVGTTPWEGVVGVGVHSVLLRGDGEMGTAPSAVKIKPGESETLKLEAVSLDSRLRVEPSPSNAQVFIDGVPVGRGVWEGRLGQGAHVVEVAAEGFVAFRQEVRLSPRKPTVTKAKLARDLEHPLWKNKVFRPHLFVEGMGGVLFSPSFRGSSDAACDEGACSDRKRPFGFVAGARGGYQLTRGLGVALNLGYLRLKQEVTRSARATSDAGQLTSDDQVDTTSLAGPFIAASASYRFFEDVPVVLRLMGGVARAQAKFSTSGTFRDPSGVYSVELDPAEPSPSLWVPLVGPEVSAGVRLGKQLEIRGGVAALLLFLPAAEREGVSASLRRQAFPTAPPDAPPGTQPLGYVYLPSEEGFGTVFSVAPSLFVRGDF